MTNMKSTKRALLSSALALFLCFAMLLGTTFAWFTDSVTSANNIITAGNLDIKLYHTDDNATDVEVDSSTKLFDDVALWEPGAVVYETFDVVNEGTLALKYQFSVNVANATKNANGGTLADVLKVGVIANGATSTTREAMLDEVATWTSLASFTLTGELEAKQESATEYPTDTYTVVIYWQPSDVDNNYNMNNGEDALKIDIGVTLLATQLTSEVDGFNNNQYDKDALYPVNITVSQPVTTDADNKTTEEVKITFTDDSSAISEVEVVVPEGTKLEDGVENLVLNVKEAEQADSTVQITATQSAKTYNISLEGLADTNAEEIEITLFIEKGLVDVKLYHKNVLIPDASYDATTGKLSFTTTGFSPFTVVSENQVFEEGNGTAENPYIIKTAEDITNISKYYHEYKYYKVADGVETLDLSDFVGNVSLNGSFDGNGVKIVNLTTALFRYVGQTGDKATIKISNMDVTVHTTNGNALVRNIFNAGETIFENVSMHGYIEGQYNMGSFYNYGTANSGSGEGSDYTVSFVNATSDVTLVCTTGNIMGGMLGHGYEGANYQLSINMDEKSGYTGQMYTTTGKNCYQVMAMCSHATYVLNGKEVSRYDNTYPSAKLTVVAPTAGADGYYVAPVDGVVSYVVALNAQLTAYDADGNKIANKSGMTGNLGSTTLTAGFDGKLFDLISSAKIVNGLDHSYSYEMNDGALTVYTGRSANYASGWITLQVTQYDAEGNILATGSTTVYTVKEPTWVSTADELKAALAAGGTVALTADINMDVTETGFAVDKGVTAKLDLNGYDIIATSTSAEGVQLFSVNGNLEIVGNGTISLTNDNYAWTQSYRYTTINIRETGVVTLGEGVNVVCEAGAATEKGYGMSYAVDIYTTGTLNVNGASLHSNYIAVRCFYGASVVTVNSGSITSSNNNWGIWPQSATGATITVAEGIAYTVTEDYGIYVFG